MKVVGQSIFLSAILGLISLIISLYVEIEGVRSFLAYAAVALLFNFLYTMTVFSAYLSMDLKRQLK